MHNFKILTIQDISCVGQCSLTVALPILSACGIETCILPSAVLSTHTAGFSGYTFRDLSEDIPAIVRHWESENISFDLIYTGYLGSEQQIDLILDLKNRLLARGGKLIVDPAMADNGKLYPAFDGNYVASMRKLCAEADVVIPNVTEACLLTDEEYFEVCTPEKIEAVSKKLLSMGTKSVVLTGVGYQPDKTGVSVYENGLHSYYGHARFEKGCHGTGDIYASAFVGALAGGKTTSDSARIAADYTYDCIRITKQHYPEHWYGARFEPSIPYLLELLR